jgi:hypothetical protein
LKLCPTVFTSAVSYLLINFLQFCYHITAVLRPNILGLPPPLSYSTQSKFRRATSSFHVQNCNDQHFQKLFPFQLLTHNHHTSSLRFSFIVLNSTVSHYFQVKVLSSRTYCHTIFSPSHHLLLLSSLRTETKSEKAQALAVSIALRYFHPLEASTAHAAIQISYLFITLP